MNGMDKEVEREEGGGMGRQAKLGLAVIAALLVVFVVVLVMKIGGSDDKTAAAGPKTPASRTSPGSSGARIADADRPWTKLARRSLAANRPTEASPKTATPRASGAGRPIAWPRGTDTAQASAAGGASPEPLILPDVSAGASGAKTLPSPGVGTRWPNQSAPVAQAPPAPVPDDTRGRATGSGSSGYNGYASSSSPYASPPSGYGSSSSSTYPSTSSGYGSGGSPYSYNPPGQADVRQYRAAYPPDNGGYPRNDYSSGSSGDTGRYGYHAVPPAEKMGRPYDQMPNRVSSGSSSYQGSSSYDNDGFYSSGSRVPSSSLSGHREDGNYVVGPNDSFWTISERLYGTGSYFQALAELNKSKFPDRSRLKPGDVVIAPETTELEDKYPDLCPSPDRRKAMRERMSTVSTRPSYRTGPAYVVQEGDTLYDIARFKLGSGARWPEIYELNLEALQGDFNYLTPGTELTLPERPTDTITRRPGPGRYGR